MKIEPNICGMRRLGASNVQTSARYVACNAWHGDGAWWRFLLKAAEFDATLMISTVVCTLSSAICSISDEIWRRKLGFPRL